MIDGKSFHVRKREAHRAPVPEAIGAEVGKDAQIAGNDEYPVLTLAAGVDPVPVPPRSADVDCRTVHADRRPGMAQAEGREVAAGGLFHSTEDPRLTE